MSFNDCKISESQIQTTGVQSQPDTLTGSAADNKMVFDALPTLAIQKLNSLIDQMQQQAAAGQIGVTPFDGMTAQTLQEALEQIQADIGGNYGGADGAGKVGYTPSEGVDEDTVQAAIEAVQANLTAYIAKIKAATGAAEVGNAPIAGMTATNVQQALEELRENIDNIVSGIIPGGSITSDMIQDGAVTADKLGSDVTGDTIPTSASDPTSISSQLSNKVSKQYPYTSDAHTIGIGQFYWCDQNTDNTPYKAGLTSAQQGIVLCTAGNAAENWCTLLYIAHAQSEMFIQSRVGEWNKWIPFSLATPPQEYDLPLAEGITALQPCTYYKNQFSEVTLGGCTSGSVSDGATIATLPEGFRPDHPIERPATFTASGNRYAGSVFIAANGIVSIHTPAEATNVVFAASFLAKN